MNTGNTQTNTISIDCDDGHNRPDGTLHSGTGARHMFLWLNAPCPVTCAPVPADSPRPSRFRGWGRPSRYLICRRETQTRCTRGDDPERQPLSVGQRICLDGRPSGGSLPSSRQPQTQVRWTTTRPRPHFYWTVTGLPVETFQGTRHRTIPGRKT